jgi:hypothetical protein
MESLSHPPTNCSARAGSGHTPRRRALSISYFLESAVLSSRAISSTRCSCSNKTAAMIWDTPSTAAQRTPRIKNQKTAEKCFSSSVLQALKAPLTDVAYPIADRLEACRWLAGPGRRSLFIPRKAVGALTSRALSQTPAIFSFSEGGRVLWHRREHGLRCWPATKRLNRGEPVFDLPGPPEAAPRQ